MATATISTTIQVGGLSASTLQTRTEPGFISQDPLLPAAVAGVASSTPGTMTMAEGHGFVESDVVDVYWTGGCRFGCAVGVVDGTAVPLTGGSGDALPAEDTAITMAEQTVIDVDFVGNKVKVAVVACPKRGHVSFRDDVPAEIAGDELIAGEGWSYFSGGPQANPLADETVASVVLSQSSTTATTAQLIVIYASDE